MVERDPEDFDNLRIKLIDFGVSGILLPGHKSYIRCGTFQYVAPEILENKGHSFEIDIWSLGCIFYQLTSSCAFF